MSKRPRGHLSQNDCSVITKVIRAGWTKACPIFIERRSGSVAAHIDGGQELTECQILCEYVFAMLSYAVCFEGYTLLYGPNYRAATFRMTLRMDEARQPMRAMIVEKVMRSCAGTSN